MTPNARTAEARNAGTRVPERPLARARRNDLITGIASPRWVAPSLGCSTQGAYVAVMNARQHRPGERISDGTESPARSRLRPLVDVVARRASPPRTAPARRRL